MRLAPCRSSSPSSIHSRSHHAMRKTDLISLLERLQLHPSRRLGQNFLTDDNCLAALVRAAAPSAGERILEIGPGTGALTEKLLEAGCRVTAVEFDHRLAEYLRERFRGHEAFQLIEGDACATDYDRLFSEGTPWRCIANLPYSCGSVIVARFCALRNAPLSLHILLQREMAQRLCATCGTADYGALTVKVALRYTAEIVRIVPPGVFFPPPEVASAYVALRCLPDCADSAIRKTAAELATAAFSQRRKKALRLLEKSCPGGGFADSFAQLHIAEDARAETITVAQYLDLARLMSAKATSGN